MARSFPWLTIFLCSLLSLSISRSERILVLPVSLSVLFLGMMMLRILLGLFRNRRTCDDLPEEVWVEIFSWLPADSLIRFKSVSRSWYHLINSLMKDQDFVNKHLRNMENISSSSTTCLVFCCPRNGYWGESKLRGLFKSVTILHDHNKRSPRKKYVCEDFCLPTLRMDQLSLYCLHKSHCNGIICLADRETVILCNPAIKEWRTLPKPCLITDGGFLLRGVLLGYDSRANDYKVVRFGHYRFFRDQIEYFKTRAEVYSLRSDSWKEIGIQLELNGHPMNAKTVFCKDIFYWYVWPHSVILSLNMFDEVFHDTVLPNYLAACQKVSVQLAVWNESIALFVFMREISITKFIQVWVPSDSYDGVNGRPCSWIKKLTIGPSANIVYPLAFLKNDEVLMKTNGGRFFLYNLHHQTYSLFTVAENTHPQWDFSYVKSLLSVQGGNQSRP